MGLTTVTLLGFVLAIAAGGFYLYLRTRGEVLFRFFAARGEPRLAFIERTKLDGGRKLLLVRRDGVEHLILIGGPIDLVVETGIRAEDLAISQARQSHASSAPSPAFGSWPRQEAPLSEVSAAAHAEPRLPLPGRGDIKGEDVLELKLRHEAKAV